jgi:phosphoglucomutase
MSCYATDGIKRVPFAAAIKADTTHQEDFVVPYVEDLKNVIDMDAIRSAWPKAGCRPAWRCGRKPYWEPIDSIYHLDIHVANPTIDPTFSFMTVGSRRPNTHGPVESVCDGASGGPLRISMTSPSPTIQTPTGTASLHLPPG